MSRILEQGAASRRPANGRQSPWLENIATEPDARLCLFCFPHGGASAAVFRDWPRRLPTGIDITAVQLPGRGYRLREPSLRRIDDLVDAVGTALLPRLDRPFALFGHSMGALLAFELARWLRRGARPLPSRLLVSGHGAPELTRHPQIVHTLPERDFVAYVRELNGTPVELLDDLEARELLLPALRADFEAVETYLFTPEAPLNCAIDVYAGTSDVSTPVSALNGWRAQTSRDCTVNLFDGGHFFINESHGAFMTRIAADLQAALDTAAGRS